MRSAAPLLAAFAAGTGAFVLQVLIPRVLAPHTGTTIEAWTTAIAVVMLGSALGNRRGGTWARRRPDAGAALLVRALGYAAVGVEFAALVGPARTTTLAYGGSTGWVASALWALPATYALGLVFPLAAALATQGHPSPGRVLGRLSAAGSAGCVVGLLGTAFVVVPHVGVRAALHGTAAGLAVVAGVLALLGRRGAAGLASRTPDLAPDLAPERAAAPTSRAPAAWTRGQAAAVSAAAGAALLLVEIVAARTCGRLTGHGLHAWTAVFLAVLLGATVGGVIGGRLADRGDPRAALARLCVVAAALVIGTAWTPAIVAALSSASGAGRPARIALGAVLAWGPACAALAAIPPVALRGALGGDDDARTVGRVTAWQTLGCLAATLLTAPLLVPWLFTGGALAATACGLALLPAGVRARVEVPFAVALGLATLACVLPPAADVGRALRLRPDGGALLVRESAYQQVRVDEPPEYAATGRARVRRLVLDGFVHGYTDLDDPTWLGYGYEGIYAAVTARLWPADARRVETYSIGGGACTFPRWLAHRYPNADVHVAELDPVVTRVARSTLGLADDGRVHVHDADGRTGIWDVGAFRRAARRDAPPDPHEPLEDDSAAPRFDLVYGDAFSDVAVPWHLTTREFIALIAQAVVPEGAYLLNVVDATGGGAFLGAIVATTRTGFAHVEVLALGEPSGGRETFVVVATHRPRDLDGLRRPDPASKDPARTLPVVRFTPAQVDAVVARAGGLVLTDDFAPVEALLAPVAGEIGR
ncbi:MAG: fused MFS/spermidine synthase [Planctomycetota bacterium]